MKTKTTEPNGFQKRTVHNLIIFNKGKNEKPD